MAQAVKHDAARTFEQPRAGQKLLFRRHFAGRPYFVEIQFVDELLRGLHGAVRIKAGQ